MRRGGIMAIVVIGVIVVVVGTGLLWFYIQMTNIGDNEITPIPTEDPGIRVVVARVDIPANTLIDDRDTLLDERTIPTDAFSNEYLIDMADAEGRVAKNVIRAGNPIRRSDLTTPGLSQQIPTAEPDQPRTKAYSLLVNSLSGVADQIRPNDFVDVVATFSIPRRLVYPLGRDDQGQLQYEFFTEIFQSTKTIVQQVQVMRILRRRVNAEGTPVAQPEQTTTEQTGASGQPIEEGNFVTEGDWLLVLAVNNQEAELIDFARNTNAAITLVLRGVGDVDLEQTIGASFDLLISDFDVPLPQPVPGRVYSEQEALTPN